MYTIHLRIIGIWMCHADCHLPAPSIRAASLSDRPLSGPRWKSSSPYNSMT